MKEKIILLAVTFLLCACGSETSLDEYEKESDSVVNEAKEDQDAFYKENGYIRRQLNLIQADLTHDGIDDLIETYMYFPPDTDMNEDLNELIQQNIWLDEVKVRVYDGSMVSSEDMGDPIWEAGYSTVHAGNGQVSIVHRDGLYYLLESSLWQGQGAVAYSYEVISLDSEGQKYISDRDSIDFFRAGENEAERTEQIQLVSDFKEELVPWYENGQLIAATDVDMERQLISTAKEQFPPEKYYDIVWNRWME